MQNTELGFTSIVTAIYNSIRNTEDRKQLSAKMAGFFRARSCEIRIIDENQINQPVFTAMSGDHPEYFQVEKEFFEVFCNRYVRYVLSENENAIVCGEEVFATDGMQSLGRYPGRAGLPGAARLLGALATCRKGLSYAIAMHRDEADPDFTEADKLSIFSLIPHLRQAMALISDISESTIQRELALKSLDRLSLGLVLVTGSGRVIFANRVAQGVIGDGWLVLRNGVIAANNIQLDNRLKQAIRSAASAPGGANNLAGDYFAVPRPGEDVPLTVRVSAVPSGLLPVDTLTASAILFIRVPEKGRLASPVVLKNLYGLTPAEIRLVQSLVEGDRLFDYAASARISINTAKTQLRNTFIKTGTTRQSELIRELASNLLISID